MSFTYTYRGQFTSRAFALKIKPYVPTIVGRLDDGD